MIPRAYVSTVLTALRGPVDVAERLFGRDHGDGPWPPRLAFEGFEANAKALAGRVLNDDTLIGEGRRQQAKVAGLRRASQLDEFAEETLEQADEEFDARRQQSRQRIEAAAEQEQRQRQAAEKKAADRKAAARQQAAAKARAESELEEAEEQTLKRRERDARLNTISKERRAVTEKRSAVATEERADQVEAQIERSRQARRSRG
jgi:hypothetical protein